MGAYGYGRHETWLDKLGAAFAAVVRVLISTLILTAWIVAVYLYRDTPTTVFGLGGGWLTVSHLIVPIGFYAIFMTNRRYGPAYSFAQVVTTLAMVSGLLLFARDVLNQIVPLDSAPSMREAVGFGGAFFLASFVSIVAFDGARGPRWWTAPLIGFLSAAVVFAAAFFIAQYAGTDAAWVDQSFTYMGLIAGEGLLLLVPFWGMRRMVPPVAGFGGY